MNYFEALVLSAVEGITEFLPISSTGHLVLTAQILKIPQTDFMKSFEIIIQLGAIFAIVFLYWKTLIANKKIWQRILAAFMPTAILGFALYKIIKLFLLGNTFVTLAALFFGGIFLILLEFMHKEQDYHKERVENIDLKTAFLIGLFQSISMIPGVSRSAATIVGGLLLGIKRKTAVEFSFLLAVPTMLAATALDLLKSNFSFTSYEYSLLTIGFLGSFCVAILVVKLFLYYIQNHNFIPFGIYRIILTILFWLLIVNK